MINCFKGKIYANKAVGMILSSKSNHLINAFGITQACMKTGLKYVFGTALCVLERDDFNSKSDHFVNAFGVIL